MVISLNPIEKVLLGERISYSTDPLKLSKLGNQYPSQEPKKEVQTQ